MTNANETLATWGLKGQYEEWYALDELTMDGKMVRVTVGTFEEVERMAGNLMFGGDDAGSFATTPFYRVTLVGEASAHQFFEACASLDAPAWAADLMTVREVADHMGRTRQAVLELIKRGRLHAEMVLGEWRVLGWAAYSFKPYER